LTNEEDTPTDDPHDCYDKEKKINAKTGIKLDPTSIHDVITTMCINLNFTNAQEFHDWLDTTTKEAVTEEVKKAQKALLYSLHTKRKTLSAYQ
jgi:hypothetical protein